LDAAGRCGVTHSVAQTVGYKMGMIIGGGVLLQIAELTGMAWPGFFVCMAGIVVRLPLPQIYAPDLP
jgi:hypothetical protein